MSSTLPPAFNYQDYVTIIMDPNELVHARSGINSSLSSVENDSHYLPKLITN